MNGRRIKKEPRLFKNFDMVYIAHMYALKNILNKSLNDMKSKDPNAISCLGTKLDSMH